MIVLALKLLAVVLVGYLAFVGLLWHAMVYGSRS